MKILLSFIIALVVHFAFSFLFYAIGTGAELLWGGILGVLSFFISLYWVQKKNTQEITSNTVMAVKNVKGKIENFIDDSNLSDLYAIAEEEFENGQIDKGLWSHALIKAKGEEKFRKIEYMKLRVKQLEKL